MEKMLLQFLRTKVVERLVIRLLGMSQGFAFWLATTLGRYIVDKWGEPVVEQIFKTIQKETIKVNAKVQIKKADEALNAGDKEEYFNRLGNI